jgi:hypothetical protein
MRNKKTDLFADWALSVWEYFSIRDHHTGLVVSGSAAVHPPLVRARVKLGPILP